MTLLLSQCSATQLEEIAGRNALPKQASMSLLRLLGLPTLDAALCLSCCSRPQIDETAKGFAHKLGVEHLMVRADAPDGAMAGYRGGKTFPVEDAVDEATMLAQRGLSPFFLEPTNRFDNRFSINITVDENGNWCAEALGRGFDTSDLQRGLVGPQWTILGPAFSQNEFVGAGSAPFSVTTCAASPGEQMRARLSSIATLLQLESEEAAREFLLATGNVGLFERQQVLDRRCVRRVITDAQLVCLHLQRRPKALPMTLAAARLADLRFVYWDITSGMTKWR